MPIFYIYGITRDDGDNSDPDAAIDKYYYVDSSDGKRYWDYRQNVVNKVKAGSVKAYTYRNEKIGSVCVVRRSIFGTEFLKTLPDSDPTDNLSSLPEM